MAQHFVEALRPPTSESKQPLFPEPRYATHIDEFVPDPLTNMHPEDSSQNHLEIRKHWMRHWIPGPSVLVFIFLIIVTGVAFCPALLANKRPFDLAIIDGVPPETDGVKILGNVFRFDWMDTSKVSVEWSVSGYGNYSLQTADGLPNNTSPASVAMDIYINDPTKPVFSYDPAHLPVTQWDGVKMLVSGAFSFNMEHAIALGAQFNAPNDWYSFSAFVFAIERATNKSVPIITFELSATGSGDFATTSEVAPSINNFTYVTSGVSTTAEVWSSTIYAGIGRSVPARALTYSMFTINWVLTLCSIITTSITFGKPSEIGVALLPITVILTIPAVRNLYVGSPPFGIFLDVIGFFPQMLIVAACTVVVMSSYAIQSMRGGSRKTGAYV